MYKYLIIDLWKKYLLIESLYNIRYIYNSNKDDLNIKMPSFLHIANGHVYTPLYYYRIH